MGTYGARTNNALDVAGIAGGWGDQPGSKILGVTMGMVPTTAELADSIVYAVDNGARVITMSLGVDETAGINAALAYAVANDVFVDCASGNDYGPVSYPANNPDVMAVGASDDQDLIADFSNHGPEIEVAAPGVHIGSTAPNQGQSFLDGTSMAAPHVAGVAALVFSANPALTGAEVRQIIRDTADDKGAAGWDQYFGDGRINAHAAVLAAGSSGPDTVSVALGCTPGSGVVPFTEQFQVGVTNLYTGFTRTDHVTLDVLTAGGMSIAGWKQGAVNIGPGDTFSTGFNTTIPAAGTVIGDNTFTLTAVDVTAAPYNQPPYPASGDTAVDSCTVTGIAP
jgi:subtilisin family serine protease